MREKLESFFAITAFVVLCTMFYFAPGCVHVPTPTGASIQKTEAGTETCIDWARTHCPTCGDAGTKLYDAGYGL